MGVYNIDVSFLFAVLKAVIDPVAGMTIREEEQYRKSLLQKYVWTGIELVRRDANVEIH